MTTRVLLFLACVLCWDVVTPGWTAERLEAPSGDILCGARCLYVGLVALGLDPGEYSDFLEKCGKVDPRGFSIGQLEEIAKKHGARTLAVKTTLENLKLREGPFVCIAHIDGDHFVNVGDISDNMVWVINPPQESSVSCEVFKKRWEGIALLLSQSELVREEDLRQPDTRKWWLISVSVLMGIVSWKCWPLRRNEDAK